MFERYEQAAQMRPGELAISNEQQAATFGTLLAQAQAVREWLPARAVVFLALPGGPHFTAIELGAFGAAAIVAPIPDKSTVREARSCFELTAADLVVVASVQAQQHVIAALAEPTTILSCTNDDPGVTGPHRVIHLQDVLAGRSARIQANAAGSALPRSTRMIQFTSGSTATPKGILLTEQNLLANLDAHQEHLRRFAGEPVFCPVPQFHAMGGAVVLEHLAYGSAVHLANRFVPADDQARLLRQHCSGVLASPNWFKNALQLGVLDPVKLPDLRSFTLGTATADQALVGELRLRFPAATIHLRYGLAEAVGALAQLDLGPGETLLDPGCVGTLMPGATLAPGMTAPGRGEPSEIRVRAATCGIARLVGRGVSEPMCGMDGYLATGDVGHVDPKGRLHLRGRLSAFLKCNGHRVNPFEIEALLREIDGVQEAIVVGVPDPVAGQRIVAWLEPAPGRRVPDAQAMQRACEAHLSPHKIPHRFVAVAALPRTPAGKPDRARIQNEIAP